MDVLLEDHDLVVKLRPLEKLAAVRWKDVRVARANVASVEAALPATRWTDLRMPGTEVPGVIKAGTYRTSRGREFWYVTRRGRAHPVTISLKDHGYARLVLGLGDPSEAERIERWAAERPRTVAPAVE
jgi:hypothetical protein